MASCANADPGMRMPLIAKAPMNVEVYLSTLKLSPHMAAIASSRASVCHWCAKALGAETFESRLFVATDMPKSRRRNYGPAAHRSHPAFAIACTHMILSFALFADAANISQEGKLNILGVFDAVQVGSLPAVHPRAHLIARFKGNGLDIGTHQVSLKWTSPSGDELWSSDGQVELSNPPNGASEVDIPLIAMIDLPLDVQGAYAMRVFVDNELCGEVPLLVRSVAPLVAPAGGLVS